MIRWVAGILTVLAVGVGGYYYLHGDPLRAELDRHWPPVNADQQRQAAIDSAASALKALAAPNVAAGADVATIQGIALDEVKSKGVTKLALATDRQLLRLTADFDVTLTPDDLPKDSDKRTLVASLAPRVERKGFAAMLARIEGNGVRVVLVETASRFARDILVRRPAGGSSRSAAST
jgi:hypothetical protein